MVIKAMHKFRFGVSAVYRADTRTHISRPLIGSRISAGFPSPAEDYVEGRLDLNQLLVKHPLTTFYMKVIGDSMIDAGIFPDDLIVVDRAQETTNKSIVVARLNNELCVKTLRIENNSVWLEPANPLYEPIYISDEADFEVWGKVIASIRLH